MQYLLLHFSYHLGHKHSEETKKRISTSRRKSVNFPKGEKHWNWQGGITSECERLRKSIEYRLWREAVFARDNFTCQICNLRGGDLEADHIKPFAFFPETRFAIDNGRTLCTLCHRRTPTYGGTSYNHKLK